MTNKTIPITLRCSGGVELSSDKNILTLEAADNAAFYIYVIKFVKTQ
ncbi:hypothetical protein J28TS4_14890 [Paenibacillus lautus]|nr:hypothetical protein J28TS4_14890 [Paenibacillus lautus]